VKLDLKKILVLSFTVFYLCGQLGSFASEMKDTSLVDTVLLDKIRTDLSKSNKGKLVVINESNEYFPARHRFIVEQDSLESLQLRHPHMSAKMMESFLVRTTSGAELKVNLEGLPNVIWTTEATCRDAIFNRKDRKEWTRFYELFPGAIALVRLGMPVYNEDSTQCLIYAERKEGYLAGQGFIFLGLKQKGKWKIVDSASLWRN
jgi:hypothetical protein